MNYIWEEIRSLNFCDELKLPFKAVVPSLYSDFFQTCQARLLVSQISSGHLSTTSQLKKSWLFVDIHLPLGAS